MTQPPLSMAVSQLEKQLGVQLLDRTSRGVELTPSGRYLQQVAYRVLSDLDLAENYLKELGKGGRGSLAVSAVPTALWGRLAQNLFEFTATHPLVEQKIEDLPPFHVLSRIHDRSVDIGFLGISSTQPPDEHFGADIVHHVWETVALRAVLPDEALSEIGRRSPISIQQLDGKTWLIPRRTIEAASLPEIIDEVREFYGVEPRRIHTVETVYTALPLIAAGLGVALLPENVAKIQVPNLGSYELIEPLPTMNTVAAWSSHNTNPVLQQFLSRFLE